jgi:hypothetical protein
MAVCFSGISRVFTNGGTRIHVTDFADTQEIQIFKILHHFKLEAVNDGPVLGVT